MLTAPWAQTFSNLFRLPRGYFKDTVPSCMDETSLWTVTKILVPREETGNFRTVTASELGENLPEIIPCMVFLRDVMGGGEETKATVTRD